MSSTKINTHLIEKEMSGSCSKNNKEYENCNELNCQEEITSENLNWINVLNFYQPPFQDLDAIRKITEECYLPVSSHLLDRPHAKAVVNINGCLLEILYKFPDGREVIENLKSLFSTKQIAITGSGKYHPILPLIYNREIERQLELQEESLSFYLGVQKRPEVLFLPECAYLPDQMNFFKEKGYLWVIIDKISLRGKRSIVGKYHLKAKESGINLLVRDREISDGLGNSLWKKYNIQTSEEFLKQSFKKAKGKDYIITVTDIEVFGHHQKERWKLLMDIYDNPLVKSISVRHIPEQFKTLEVETIPGSWFTSKKDISSRIYYPLWYHPQNRLHRLLWQLLDHTLYMVRSHGSESQNKTMDKLMSSYPFFWSSCMPWWNGVIPERASDNMVNLLAELEGGSERLFNVAQNIRKKIYYEVSMMNKTGKSKRTSKTFLKKA